MNAIEDIMKVRREEKCNDYRESLERQAHPGGR